MTDEFDSFYQGMNERERNYHLALRNLKRYFPDHDLEHDPRMNEELVPLVLHRVMASMLHMDTVFSMQQTFESLDVYIEEAIIYKAWLESDESWPPIKYEGKPVEELDEEQEEQIQTRKKEHGAQHFRRKARKVDKNSKYQQCTDLVYHGLKNGYSRASMIESMVNNYQMLKSTAESYFSKIKADLNGI